ncbi:Uncharacterised protein [Bordetella pertussis]|nr:Uncharacterised protein [Bordetella pertussis]
MTLGAAAWRTSTRYRAGSAWDASKYSWTMAGVMSKDTGPSAAPSTKAA